MNVYDITVLQGSRYRLIDLIVCDWQTDFTGWTGAMMVRPNRTATAPLLADLSAYLSVDAPNSQVILDIPANATQILTATWDYGQYDIEVHHPTDATKTLRVLQGKLSINNEVTH